MKLTNKLQAWFQRKTVSWASAWLRGEDAGGGSGSQLMSALHQSTWVYSCITTLAENVSCIPFRLTTGAEDNEEVLQDGDIVRLFNHPHPLLDRYQFWELIVSWLALRGEAFVVPVDRMLDVADKGRVEWLIVLNPDKFREDVRNNELQGWRYTGSILDPLAGQYFLPSEVVHIKLSNPYNFWRGLSPLTVAMLAAQTDFASANFMKGTMLNNADTGLIVTTEHMLDEPQRQQIEAALRQRKRLAGRADLPLFLTGGAKVEKPSISAVDLQFLENRKFNRQEICAIYKVPQELLGFTEDANRSVSDAARLNFTENRVAPLCKRLEASLAGLIERIQPGVRGEFHVKGTPIMQAAQRARADVAVKMFGIGVPFDELNQVYDLGFKKLKHGEASFLPYSLIEYGQEQAPSTNDQGASTQPTENNQDPYEKFAKALKGAVGGAAAPPYHQCGAEDAYAQSIKGSEKLKRQKLKSFFFRQRQNVLSKLDAVSKELAHARAGGGVTLAALSDAATKAIEDIFNITDENKIIWGRMAPLLRGDLEFGAAQLLQDIGIEDDFRIPPEKALEFLGKRKNEIEGINETTFDRLKAELQAGLKDGETMAQLSDRVREVFNATESRADTIALTETNIAVNAGRFEGMRAAQVERKGWATANLENVRATHAQAARDYAEPGIPLDEAFIVGGARLMHPGDPSGPAEEVINCRCFTFAIADDAKAVKSVKPLSFEAWAKGRGMPV